jgi:hypothetical protein
MGIGIRHIQSPIGVLGDTSWNNNGETEPWPVSPNRYIIDAGGEGQAREFGSTKTGRNGDWTIVEC